MGLAWGSSLLCSTKILWFKQPVLLLSAAWSLSLFYSPKPGQAGRGNEWAFEAHVKDNAMDLGSKYQAISAAPAREAAVRTPQSLLYSRMIRPSSLSLPSCWRCFIISVTSCWTFSNKLPSFFLSLGAWSWTQQSGYVSPVPSRGKGSSLLTAAPKVVQDAFGLGRPQILTSLAAPLDWSSSKLLVLMKLSHCLMLWKQKFIQSQQCSFFSLP